MNHPSELSTPSRCPFCQKTSWTHGHNADTEENDWYCNGCGRWLQTLAKLDAENKGNEVKAGKEPTFYMREPNMEAARVKIIGILQEHKLMGCVMMSDEKRSGFFHEVSPPWSCAVIEDGPKGVELRVRSKREDYESLEQQIEHVTATVQGLMGMLHVHKFIGEMLTQLMMLISAKMEINFMAGDSVTQRIKPKDQ